MNDSEVDLFNAIVFEELKGKTEAEEQELDELSMLLFARHKFEGIPTGRNTNNE